MKEKKKKKSGWIWIAIIIVFSILSEVGEEYDSDFWFVIIGIAIVVFVIFAVSYALVKATNKKNASVKHSHDRLSQNTNLVESIDDFEHYRRQLDGFLEAGIIDKNEYKVLFKKYRETIKN